MKFNLLLSILCFLGHFQAISQKPNYEIYHGYINKAEELFFVEGKPDSSLYYYKKAFTEFDFVFAKDPLNAAQIAYFSQQPFEEYLVKGFENGLKLSHSQKRPYHHFLFAEPAAKAVYNDIKNEGDAHHYKNEDGAYPFI